MTPDIEPLPDDPLYPYREAPGQSVAFLPPPPLVLGPVERYFIRPIIYLVKGGALGIAMLVWILFGPVWVAMVFRTMTAFSFATITSLFANNTIPNPARLEYVVAFWLR